MPISDKHKLIFIHIPKNAGTSITNHLEMEDIGHHNWSYYAARYPNKWSEYKKISIIRNPWDRVVSCYEYAKMENSYWHSASIKSKAGKHPDYELLKDRTFEECLRILDTNSSVLRHHGWTSQFNYVIEKDSLMVDKIIDIQNINEDLSILLDDLVEIPMINISKTKNYKDYYVNEEMVNIVSKKYEEDIKHFNFKTL
jgi:hypothetical protein|tara:strand:- start:100 stop:693 length:594 start_codon:yes stop_codon:yes gene_type:complete